MASAAAEGKGHKSKKAKEGRIATSEPIASPKKQKKEKKRKQAEPQAPLVARDEQSLEPKRKTAKKPKVATPQPSEGTHAPLASAQEVSLPVVANTATLANGISIKASKEAQQPAALLPTTGDKLQDTVRPPEQKSTAGNALLTADAPGAELKAKKRKKKEKLSAAVQTPPAASQHAAEDSLPAVHTSGKADDASPAGGGPMSKLSKKKRKKQTGWSAVSELGSGGTKQLAEATAVAALAAEVDPPVKKKKKAKGVAALHTQPKTAKATPKLQEPSEPLPELVSPQGEGDEHASRPSKKRKKDKTAVLKPHGPQEVDKSLSKTKKRKKARLSGEEGSTAAESGAKEDAHRASSVPVASEQEIKEAAEDGKAAGLLENTLANQMDAEAIVGPAATRKGTAAKAFQRVKAEEWLQSKAARDNSYEATFGNQGWGAKAQEVLGQVRGKDFRHEKTKKKRGSYRGGAIDHAVNSFKFESDDE